MWRKTGETVQRWTRLLLEEDLLAEDGFDKAYEAFAKPQYTVDAQYLRLMTIHKFRKPGN